MKALQLLSFFNSRGRALHPYRFYMVDDGVVEGEMTRAYPVMHVDIDEVAKEILLILRFPDEPERGAALETIGAFLDAFLPPASDHPDFAVEASVPMQIKQFSRFDMPIVGVNGSDERQTAMLLADGLDYLENLTSG